MRGQVTPVPSASLLVARAIAPMTLHTNGELPWRVVHGWKMIGDEGEAEAYVLGAPGEVNEFEWSELLARK
jgi:hypothetical protein